jgi:predicted MFS family arabinose efflux permease
LLTPQQRAGIIEFFGLKRSMVGLLSMAVLVGLGEKLAERFLPLYLLALGGGTLAVGMLNGLDNFLSALYSYQGGYLADRLGPRRALRWFNLVSMLGYIIVIVFPYWQAVLVGAVFFISWTAISLPAIMDLVSRTLPAHKRTMGVSMHSLVKRVPMALGPVLGGIMIAIFGEVLGIRLAFALALVTAIVSLVIQERLLPADPQRSEAARASRTPALALLPPALRRLLVADILVRFCEQIPYAFVVIWCVRMKGISAFEFGLLTTVEMATSVLVYVPVAYLADRGTKKPYVVTTFLFFTLFPLVLLFAHSFWPMALAFVIRGLKEFGEPTRKALIMDLAPADRKAAAFGVYYLVRDVIVSVAAFGGALLWDGSALQLLAGKLGIAVPGLAWLEGVASPTLNFLVASAFGLAGTIYFALFGSDLGRRTEAAQGQ